MSQPGSLRNLFRGSTFSKQLRQLRLRAQLRAIQYTSNNTHHRFRSLPAFRLAGKDILGFLRRRLATPPQFRRPESCVASCPVEIMLPLRRIPFRQCQVLSACRGNWRTHDAFRWEVVLPAASGTRTLTCRSPLACAERGCSLAIESCSPFRPDLLQFSSTSSLVTTSQFGAVNQYA